MRHEISSPKGSRRAFTLVEMLVAVSVFAVLMAVILVPVKMSLDSFALSRAKAETQSALGASVSQIESDLRRATRVFPNSGPQSFYLRSNTNDNLSSLDACDTSNNQRFSNPARLDMILMARDSNGATISPTSSAGTIVTYYTRRADPSRPFSFSENPMLLFRAETPFRIQNPNGTLGGKFLVGGVENAKISALAPADCSTSADQTRTKREMAWRMHTRDGEANLEPFTKDNGAAGIAFGSHQLAIPSDLALVAPNAYRQEDPSAFPATPIPTPGAAPLPILLPESTFSTFDTNGDGKIDRVSLNLSAQSFSAQGSNLFRNNRPSGVPLRVSRVVDLPNIQ